MIPKGNRSASEQQRFISCSCFMSIVGQTQLCFKLSSILGSRVSLWQLLCGMLLVSCQKQNEIRGSRPMAPKLSMQKIRDPITSAQISPTETSPMAKPDAKRSGRYDPPGLGGWMEREKQIFRTVIHFLVCGFQRLEPQQIFLEYLFHPRYYCTIGGI